MAVIPWTARNLPKRRRKERFCGDLFSRSPPWKAFPENNSNHIRSNELHRLYGSTLCAPYNHNVTEGVFRIVLRSIEKKILSFNGSLGRKMIENFVTIRLKRMTTVWEVVPGLNMSSNQGSAGSVWPFPALLIFSSPEVAKMTYNVGQWGLTPISDIGATCPTPLHDMRFKRA